jgi:hypothetical protein
VHRRLKTLAILAAAAFPSQHALAQRQTSTNTNAWFVFNADVAVSEKWAVLFDASVTERRIWQQVQLSHEIGRLDVSHRYRLEQRYRGRRNDPEVDHIDYWERSNRFRYQVKGTLPLSGEAIEQGEAYVSLANELFVGIGRNVQRNIFDQNRATFAVGYRLTRNWRTEVGFLEHVIFKPNGTDVERNHTVTFTLSYSRPHVRPIGVTPSR